MKQSTRLTCLNGLQMRHASYIVESPVKIEIVSYTQALQTFHFFRSTLSFSLA